MYQSAKNRKPRFYSSDKASEAGTLCRSSLAGAAALLTALLASTSAHAQTATTNWATWDLPTSYDLNSVGAPGWTNFTYAPGATGSVVNPTTDSSIAFTLSGEVASMSSATNVLFWNNVYPKVAPATAYLSEYVGTSPATGAFITQTGYTTADYKAHSLSFSTSVSDLIMGILTGPH